MVPGYLDPINSPTSASVLATIPKNYIPYLSQLSQCEFHLEWHAIPLELDRNQVDNQTLAYRIGEIKRITQVYNARLSRQAKAEKWFLDKNTAIREQRKLNERAKIAAENGIRRGRGRGGPSIVRRIEYKASESTVHDTMGHWDSEEGSVFVVRPRHDANAVTAPLASMTEVRGGESDPEEEKVGQLIDLDAEWEMGVLNTSRMIPVIVSGEEGICSLTSAILP